ncbi:mitochondrial inner membrane protein OXA1-like [Rutidosis leptorrhynchoides]|uniref:mitochondrial inner membrane protein OXA1-like n=1 Tax=Rutidosis leptorrhynchoides TaxID=125765 RepID=UPI003A98FB55
MAYRRSLTTKLKQFTQQQHRLITPSISHLNHDDENQNNQYPDVKLNRFMQSRSYGGYGNKSYTSSGLGFGGSVNGVSSWSRYRYQLPMRTGGLLLARNISSTTIGDGVDKIEYLTDLADDLTEKTIEVMSNQAPAISEVAIAVADSWPPVAALQYAIDGIHSFTGLNWWASIVITTLIIRTCSIPIMINQLKATTKLTILRPQLEEIKQEMQDKGMSPSAVADGQDKMKAVFKEHGVSTFTPLKGLLFQGPVFVSFFLAIQNMVEKVPSFKTGGVSWFLDLTTADPFYFLPCLTAFSFWITVEFNMQEGLEGNPAASTMKNVSRAFAALTVPLTASFPKALFCYWITSNLFSLVYGLIIKRPGVKKLLNIPIIVPPPPSPAGESKPAFSFFEGMKKYAAAKAMQQRQLEAPTPTTTNQRVSKTSVLSNRIRILEKNAKGRKKNKRA